LKTSLYKPLGFLFLGLAVLGIVLPILPATPFLLLAAWFFARSSEKWHQWLLANRTFGPLINNWEQHRCITSRTKLVAIASMLIAGGGSVFFALDNLWLRLATGVFMSLGAAVVLSIRSCSDCDEPG
jgi:uncharacterized membrane protein YbaN (DUF454 family)